MKNSKNQDGVTLVISIVLLAAVTFISFSLSTIIIREVGAARLLLQSEPAISGAEAGVEVGIYQLFRETGTISGSGNLPGSGASYVITPDLYDNPYKFTNATSTLQVALYDPTNPDNQAAGYGTVKVTNSAGSNPIKADVFSYADLKVPVCSSPSIPAGNSYTCPASGTLQSADDRYLVQISVTAGTASGEVDTTDDAGGPKGVPTAFPEIEVTGQSGNVKRRLDVNLGG